MGLQELLDVVDSGRYFFRPIVELTGPGSTGRRESCPHKHANSAQSVNSKTSLDGFKQFYQHVNSLNLLKNLMIISNWCKYVVPGLVPRCGVG
jgi:hypothetical protein